VKRTKSVVLLSGGVDSAVTLYRALYLEEDVLALAFDYGQRHKRELRSALRIADRAGVELKVLDVASVGLFEGARSSQVGRMLDVPTSSYNAESMRTTVIPNRNMLLLSMAGCVALSVGATKIYYGAHAGDHALYPDCRPAFVALMASALAFCSDGGLVLEAPFLLKTKAEIVAYGASLHVPFELTYSCYVGEREHCGRCGTCRERRAAFRDAGVYDPTSYETAETE
jgi:7-cyano-7-deazaguanine synthase